MQILWVSCLPSMEDAKAYCTKDQDCPKGYTCDLEKKRCVHHVSKGDTQDTGILFPDSEEFLDIDVGLETMDMHQIESLCHDMGCSCETNLDCPGGWCIETPLGKQCSPLCNFSSVCPQGFVCRQVPNQSGIVYACVHPTPRLCFPCKAKKDCYGSVIVDEMECASLKGLHYCLASCTKSSCPLGYQCEDIDEKGNKACVPLSGTCECHGDKVGLCEVQSDMGKCMGEFTCTSSCTAKKPEIETCNGEDDDCDGYTDEDIPSVPCDITNPYGTCKGTTKCASNGEIICIGSPPMPEACNGIDDDCDGLTDEQENTCYPNLEVCLKGECKSLCGPKQCIAGFQVWDACHCKVPPTAVKQCTNGMTFVDCSTIKPDMGYYGQDGHFGTGSMTFSKLTPSTIQDLLTGLVWAKDYVPYKTISEAIEECDLNKSGLAGSGWHLPSLYELISIVDYARSDCPKWANIFGNECPPSGWFWTSTKGPSNSYLKVHFGDGSVSLSFAGQSNVRCVRGGNLEVFPERFLDMLDGTILDRATGLYWKVQPQGLSMTWKEALGVCVKIGWRLPDIKELVSIIDLSKTTCPRWDTVFGQTCPWQTKFWSSTPTPWEPTSAYKVDFNSGEVSYDNIETAGNGVRCVL